MYLSFGILFYDKNELLGYVIILFDNYIFFVFVEV